MVTIDGLDEKIISMLRADSQTRNKAIAEKLKVAETTIATRIRGLAQRGVLRVTTQWDMAKLGLDYMSYLRIDPGAPGNLKQAVALLRGREDVFAVATTTGYPQLMVMVLLAERQRIVAFMDTVLSALSRARVVECLSFVRIVKYQGIWGAHVEENTGALSIDGIAPRFALDRFDLDMVGLYREDARISNREVARCLDVSETKVRLRINRLKAEGALRFGTVVFPGAFGYTTYANVMVRVSPGSIGSVCEQLARADNVVFVAQPDGRHNIYLGMIARDISVLADQAHALLAKHRAVEEIEITPVLHSYKHRYDLVCLSP